MNRSEQEHLFRQSRQVSVVRSSPALRPERPEDLLLHVLQSPVTRDRDRDRRKSSSVLLKPPLYCPERRASARSAIDAELPFIDAQSVPEPEPDPEDDEVGEEPDVDEGDAEETAEISPRYVWWCVLPRAGLRTPPIQHYFGFERFQGFS